MQFRLNAWDRLALVVSLMTVLISSLVTNNIFEGLPHLEDEYTYVWQAQAIAGGHAILPSPACSKCFLVPFVIDYHGSRFGKYPLAWPVVLSLGEKLDFRALINPILAGFSVWLIYLLGKKVLDEKTAVLAAFLTLLSPFFLINAGTLLSHMWALFLSLAFVLAWLDLTSENRAVPAWLPVACAGLTLGVLILTRPLTAVGVTLPFFIHGMVLMARGPSAMRKKVLIIGAVSIVFLLLYLGWQYSLTGDALRNPYTLWWPYDTVGFGPGIGRQTGGYNLHDAWFNLKISLRAGSADLFGWLNFSWLFLPFGLIALRKNARALLAVLPSFTLVFVYLFYWIGSSLFGPRYYFEGIFGAILLTATGIVWLAGVPRRLPRANFAALVKSLPSLRFSFVYALLLVLVAGNVLFYLPRRLNGLRDLYNTSSERLKPFLSPQARALTPALVIVHAVTSWEEYAVFLNLSSPYWNTPFVFSLSQGDERDRQVEALFPGRSVWHYYPDQPYELLPAPR